MSPEERVDGWIKQQSIPDIHILTMMKFELVRLVEEAEKELMEELAEDPI